jgi:hypothetical protein
VLRHHLERIDPVFPPIEDDVEGFVVPSIE